MKYRILGRTGLKVSELGFGGHEYRRWLNTQHFPGEWNRQEFLKTQPQRNKLIETAIDAGINYFDTTLVEEAKSLGSALNALGRRKDVYMSAMIVFLFRRMKSNPKTTWRDIVAEGVEERLRLLRTDHIDVFNIHMPEVDYSRDKLEVTLEVLSEMKRQGKVGWIGASSHELGFLAELIRKYDCFDSVMVQYNYHLQGARDTVFPLTKALEVGVVVMKPFSWPYYGIPFMRFGPAEGEGGQYTPAQISLRWILSSPEVATVVPSMNAPAELEENLHAITKEGRVDERVLDLYLKAARGDEAKEKLTSMLKDPAIDVSNYAKRALAELDQGSLTYR